MNVLCRAPCRLSRTRLTVQPLSRSLYKMASPAALTKADQETMVHMSKIQARDLKKQKARDTMTYFVLGHRPDNADLWNNSLLARITVTPENLKATFGAPPVEHSGLRAPIPPQLGFGIGAAENEAERKLLFRYLPDVSLQQAANSIRTSKAGKKLDVTALEETEISKVEQLSKIIDLRNASAREIRAENTRRCIAAFSAPGNATDSGRAEVQAALLTVRIRGLWRTMEEHGMTAFNRIALRKMCYERKTMLRFLKKQDRDRYDICLLQIGLEPEAVEHELYV